MKSLTPIVPRGEGLSRSLNAGALKWCPILTFVPILGAFKMTRVLIRILGQVFDFELKFCLGLACALVQRTNAVQASEFGSD